MFILEFHVFKFYNNICRPVSWEFEESEEDPVTSIPYQLQRLFVLLQTSKKRAIETTDVTRSFGWDSSEGEHLHSIMFRLCVSRWCVYWHFSHVLSLAAAWYPGAVQGNVWCSGAEMEADSAGRRKQEVHRKVSKSFPLSRNKRPCMGNKRNGPVSPRVN